MAAVTGTRAVVISHEQEVKLGGAAGKPKVERPEITDATDRVFARLSHAIHPSLNLSKKIAKIQTLEDRLQNAKDHPTRDKILGVLKSMLFIAIVVGGLLAWSPGITIPSLICATLLGCYYAYRAEVNIEKANYGMFFCGLLGGAFFPLYEEFGKIARLEGRLEEKRASLTLDIQAYDRFFGAERIRQLEGVLKTRIGEIEEEQRKYPSLRDRNGELEGYRAAVAELEKVKAYMAAKAEQ